MLLWFGHSDDCLACLKKNGEPKQMDGFKVMFLIED